jgi:hypothetical protein
VTRKKEGKVSVFEERREILELSDSVPLTSAEVALATGLSSSTLRKWACMRREGDLLPYAKRGGRNLYKPSDVRAWLGLE